MVSAGSPLASGRYGAGSELASYHRERRRLFARLGATWPGTVPDPYELLALHSVDIAEVRAIADAAAAICRIYARLAGLLRRCPDATYGQMGLPAALHAPMRARIPGMAEVALGRLDLVRTARGYALLEFNADVPGMLVEGLAVNRLVCEDARAQDMNEGQEAVLARGLESAISSALDHLRIAPGERPARVAFAVARGFARDLDLARYLSGLLALPGAVDVEVCAAEDLQADEDGLYGAGGERVDVLFRLVPLLAFPAKGLRTAAGAPRRTWLHLPDLVERRRLVLINPPSSGLLNSKAAQTIIWNLHRSGQFFDAAEHALVERHLLPTFLDPVFGGEPHVVKPACGRGGDSVRIVDARESASDRDPRSTYADQPMVYQQYMPLPTVHGMTEDGPRRLHVVASSFIVNGMPAGVCFRAGGRITDESAWFVPTALAGDDSRPRIA